MAEAQNRRNGHCAYAATGPKLGGLRVDPVPPEDKLVQHVKKHWTVKLCQVFPLYVNVQALSAKPGFACVQPRQCRETDVVVLDKMADIDLVQNQHLVAASVHSVPAATQESLVSLCGSGVCSKAAALLYVYAFGKVLACREDLQAFMASPSVENEAKMLHFKPAIYARIVGVQLRGPVAEHLYY